jgi:UDP-GlcNAc:undecaprenyl-phosphate GlcNAc-1-phosphate transferase
MTLPFFILSFKILSLACFISSITVPILIRISTKLGLTDKPSERKIHPAPISNVGGIALFVGFFIPVLIFIPYSLPLYFPIILNAALFMGMGLLDDIFHAKAWIKLAGQLLISTLSWAMGIGFFKVSLPFLGAFNLGLFSLPFTLLFMVGIINAVNLIDGIDGLATAILTLTFLTFFGFMCGSSEWLMGFITVAVLGASLGFLVFNFPPAKIFLGDSGSMMLGYLAAALCMTGVMNTTISPLFFVPLLVLAIPILDVLHTIWRRIRTQKALFTPDLGHIHHMLLDKGYSQQRIVCILSACTALMGLCSLLIFYMV